MVKPVKYTVTRSEIVAGQYDTVDPDNMIKMRNAKMAEPDVLQGTVRFSIDSRQEMYDPETYYDLVMKWDTYETDEELERRIEHERIHEEARKIRDRAEYERLAKQFEGK